MRFLVIIVLNVLMMAVLPRVSPAGTEYEQLVVFVQPGDRPVDTVFQSQRLPQVRKLAGAMGVPLYVVDVGKKAPQEVALTPLIVFQNHRGRSIYQGRTTTIERIRNFIRTSRYIPQGNEPNHRNDIPVWQKGRTRMWAPLKVAAVTGYKPAEYDHDRFVAQALDNIGDGFKQFRIKSSADLGRADRGFYMDFYPWLSKDGTLYLSLALYSQFHCKEPVYTEKIIGPWENRAKLFRKAAILMEQAVARQIADPANGDSFDPVPAVVSAIGWDSFGFPLPPPPPQKTVVAASLKELPTNWILEMPGASEPPMIIFRFPAPLDNYSGEVTAASGQLVLPRKPYFEGARGFVEVNTGTAVTMGNDALDEAIRGSIVLGSRYHPTSRFEVESISGDGQPIGYGRLSPALVTGDFYLKGKKKSLAARGEFEPVVGEDGLPRLLFRGRFRINLLEFEIEGADGPVPARDTVLFDISMAFKGNTP